MLAVERAKKRPPGKRKPAVKKTVTISYWSQGENRYKTRTTTCMFKPSPQ